MNTLTEKLTNNSKRLTQSFWSLTLPKKLFVLLLLGGGAVLIVGHNNNKNEVVEETPQLHSVSLASVSELSMENIPLTLLGSITSRSEATIRAESGGKITALYRKLGDTVQVGQTIAELENSSERAQVLQAEGVYDAARAAKDVAGVNKGSTNLSKEEAQTSAVNTLLSVYLTLDDAIRTKTDPAFHNPQTARDVKLVFNSSDSRSAATVEETRSTIETLLRAREARNHTISTASNLISELDAVEEETRTIKNYLDDLALLLSHAIPDQTTPQATIEVLKTSTTLARTGVAGALTGVTQSRNALNQSIAASTIAEKNFDQSSSTSATDAQIKSALGNLRQAQSRLEKTIVRSPISGTINSLTIKEGDFLSPYSEIAIVSNNNALEVLAYVTEEEAVELMQGDKVAVDKAKGVITSIAPALDPKTKKIEVRIGLTGSTDGLVNGQSVSVAIARTHTTQLAVNTPLRIPLSALKLTPTGAMVFTVSASSTLVAHPVKEGTLQGEKIMISEGLTPEMRIVTDARGLKEGIIVSVK